MADKKIDEKEAQESKKIYHQFSQKRSEILKNTQFKVEDLSGDILSKKSYSSENYLNLTIFQPNDVITI